LCYRGGVLDQVLERAAGFCHLAGVPCRALTILLSLGWKDDVLPFVVEPTGLLLGLAGLVYAILEIRKTKGAAEAAASSAERTSKALVQNHLLFLIPELTRLSSEIDAAVATSDAGRTLEVLSHWRNGASRTRGLLRARGDVPRNLGSAFTGAFAAISDARIKLRMPSPDVTSVTEASLRAIDKVMDEIGDLGGQMLGDPQGAD
jgi:hypothetical protein